MQMRLQKYIAQCGYCSRRRAETMIEHGHVRVNGEIATIGMDVDPEKDKILVNGQYLKPEKKIYLMLNKPKGYITTASDPYGRKNVVQLVHESKRVVPVGRLDRGTTGLIFLSNDGDFTNRITHPRYEVKKTYEATLDKRLEDEDLIRMNAGVIIDGKRINAKVRKLAPARASVTIHTGLNKEVKRIFKKFGYWVKDLRRTEINGVKLDVKEGKYRHLHASEVKKLIGESL